MPRIALCIFLLLSLGCATAGPRAAPAPEISEAAAAEIAGAPPTIGVQVVDVSARALRGLGLPPEARGALLHEVLRQGPADRARLAAGDLIQAVDGAPVETVCAFLKVVSERSAGTKVTLSVLRSLNKMEVVLSLANTAQLFKASCDAGDAKGCQSLGAIYSLLGRSPASSKAAAALYSKACEGGAAVGCSSLGSVYLGGQGVGQDEARALRLFEQACQHGDAEACTSYATQYATGCGVPRDDVKATPFYVRACDGGDPEGCYNVGVMYGDGRDWKAVKERVFCNELGSGTFT